MNSNKFMYVSMYPRLKQLQNKLFANIGMLQLTVKFVRCKLPYKFQEDITVSVSEEARSEEVAETCAKRVQEKSVEYGQPFGLEQVSIFVTKRRKPFVLGKASEHFVDGDDVYICGNCVCSNSHADRDHQDEKAAASAPAAALSACASKQGQHLRAHGNRGGRPMSAESVVAHLKNAVEDHLSAIYLISKHASAEHREQAQCILERYKKHNLCYHTGWEKNPSSPLTDWNRMGVYVMSSFVHVERSYAAARTNLCKAELSKQKTKKNNAAKISTKPDECFAVKVKRNQSKNSIKQEAGKAKAGNLKPWTNALKQARQNLGLDRHVTGKKGSELYKEAKKILRENI
jgi:hypothetical protein